jgi:hypothetical protein
MCIGTPFTSSAPPVGCRLPASSFTRDVLPLPLGPITASSCAGSSCPDRECKMRLHGGGAPRSRLPGSGTSNVSASQRNHSPSDAAPVAPADAPGGAAAPGGALPPGAVVAPGRPGRPGRPTCRIHPSSGAHSSCAMSAARAARGAAAAPRRCRSWRVRARAPASRRSQAPQRGRDRPRGARARRVRVRGRSACSAGRWACCQSHVGEQRGCGLPYSCMCTRQATRQARHRAAAHDSSAELGA